MRSLEQVKLDLRAIAEQAKRVNDGRDHSVTVCQYVVRGEPHCIIGRLLWLYGADMTDWESRPGLNGEHIMSVCHSATNGPLRGLFDLETLRYLRLVQWLQDRGTGWVQALDLADDPEALVVHVGAQVQINDSGDIIVGDESPAPLFYIP